MKAWMGGVVAVMGLAAACSSSNSASDSCGKVSACGGNLVGTWKVVTTCGGSPTATPMMAGCSGESVSTNSSNASGTFTFNADMTYSLTASEMSSETLTIPSSCLSQGGVMISCDQIGQVFSAGSQGSDAGGVNVSCGNSGGNCSCTFDISVPNLSETGMWATSGNNVTLTPSTAGGVGTPDGYCVSGNTLHILSGGSDAGGGSGFSFGDVVLAKQ